MKNEMKNKLFAGFTIGAMAGFLTIMLVVYLFALPVVSQAYKASFVAGMLTAKAQQNSTIANALIIATFTCASTHNDLLTTKGIAQLYPCPSSVYPQNVAMCIGNQT